MIKKRINVIDLDHTLIPYDSFRLLIKNELFKLDLFVFKLTLIRVFRIILMDEYKMRLVNYLRLKYDSDFFKRFVDKISKDIDQDVMSLINNEIDDNTINILLSASPNIFVEHLVQKLGWTGTGSYIDIHGNFIHLYGREKVNWLLKTYNKDNFYYNFAISDSSSDDELLELFEKNKKWTLH